MKKTYLLLFTLICLSFNACKHDDDVHVECEECEDCEECEELPGYKNYTVDFFSTHKDFQIIPTLYETVTEQVLVREAHQEGAFFETYTEQYLVKESTIRHEILEKETIYLVANSETDSIAEIECYNFFEEADFVELEVPAHYANRAYYLVVQEGTGAQVPAEYATLTKQIVSTHSEIVPATEEQAFTRIGFRIREDWTMENYLTTQFAQQEVLNCFEGNGYRIND